jgi:hypothetical protein
MNLLGATGRKALPLPLPALPPDERLVVAIADETSNPAGLVRRWLTGGQVPGSMLGPLRASLWKPLGGLQ